MSQIAWAWLRLALASALVGLGLGAALVEASWAQAAGQVWLNTHTRRWHEASCRYAHCPHCRPVARSVAQAKGRPCRVCHRGQGPAVAPRAARRPRAGGRRR